MLQQILHKSKQQAERQAQATHRAVYEFIDQGVEPTSAPELDLFERLNPRQEATSFQSPVCLSAPFKSHWVSTEEFLAACDFVVEAEAAEVRQPQQPASLAYFRPQACLTTQQLFARLG
jgi:hypothetical protein